MKALMMVHTFSLTQVKIASILAIVVQDYARVLAAQPVNVSSNKIILFFNAEPTLKALVFYLYKER